MKLKFSPMGATKVLPKIESLKRQPQIAAASVVAAAAAAAAAAAVADNTAPSAWRETKLPEHSTLSEIVN